jgi:membrane-bound lytic murein transglycosylase B
MSGPGARRRAGPLGVLALVACATAASAAAIDIERPEVQAFIDEVVARDALDRARVATLLAAAETKSAIIDAMNRPIERARPWFEYRALFVSDKRIADGREFYATHRALLEDASRRTGVPAAIIAAIVGVESNFGAIPGHWRVLDALATLAFDYPPRAAYFRGELEQFLLLVREAGFDPLTVTGSYAGAMGAPQFMPGSYRSFALDGDGDGRIDLWNDWPDIVESVAHYFVTHGWHRGEPVFTTAGLFDPDVEDLPTGHLELNHTVESLATKGVLFTSALPGDAPALFVALQGVDGPTYRVGFHNFWVITRYNRHAVYALAVAELAAAIDAAAAPVRGVAVPPGGGSTP